MIDAYEMVAAKIMRADAAKKHGLQGDYVVVTLHRPANVDHPKNLVRVVAELLQVAEQLPVVFPVHPRTRAQLEAQGLLAALRRAGVVAIEPLGYIEFMSLVCSCRLAVTDSGGLQEETSYLGIPCITVRDTTERPITLTIGTNLLAPIEHLAAAVRRRLSEPPPARPVIPLWDGGTAERIVKLLQTERVA
jgi:UDP-N-acetylglucosamine 2-epimerase (non-hydrolysing)